MSDSDELLEAIQAGNRSFEQFKTRIDARLSGLERLEAKMFNRPQNGGMDGAARTMSAASRVETHDPATEAKAFDFGCHPRRLRAQGDEHRSSSDGGYTVPKLFSTNRCIARHVAAAPICRVGQSRPATGHPGVCAAWAPRGSQRRTRVRDCIEQFTDVKPPMGDCTRTSVSRSTAR